MKKETCETCARYSRVVTGTYYDEGLEEEVETVRHLCDGKQIGESMATNFRCGMYEPRDKRLDRKG